MILDNLLEKRGLSFDKLQGEEKELYIKWLDILEAKPLSIEDLKSGLRQMREAVENELVEMDEFVYVLFLRIVNRKHVALKARLKNYLLLEAFLDSKERAKKGLEKQIEKMIEAK